MGAQSDARLSALAAGGSDAAFEAIHERYVRELRSYASRFVRPDRAEDVTQQAMLVAWGALMEAAEPVVDVRAWLYRIVRNTALNTRQRRGYDDAELPETATSSATTEEIAESRAGAAAALAAISALPDAQRRALTMTAIDGFDGRRVAQELGLSESATRQLVHRARSRVRTSVSVLTPWPLLLLAARGAGAGPAAASLAGSGGLGLGVSKLAAVAAVAAVAAGSVAASKGPAPAPAPARPAADAGDPSGPSLALRTAPTPIASGAVRPVFATGPEAAALPRAVRRASIQQGDRRNRADGTGSGHDTTGARDTAGERKAPGSSNRPSTGQHVADSLVGSPDDSAPSGRQQDASAPTTTATSSGADESGSSSATPTVAAPGPAPRAADTVRGRDGSEGPSAADSAAPQDP